MFALVLGYANVALAAAAPAALSCLPSDQKKPERIFEAPHPQPYTRGFEQLRADGYTCSSVIAPGEVWDCFREKKPDHIWAIGVDKAVAIVPIGDEDTAEATCISGATSPVIAVTQAPLGLRSILKLFQWSGSIWQPMRLPQGLRQGDSDIDNDGRIEPNRVLFDAVWKACRGEECPPTTRNGYIHIEVSGPVRWNGRNFSANSPLSVKTWEQQFAYFLMASQSTEPVEDLNAKAELGNLAASTIIAGRMLGLPREPVRLALHAALKILEPSLRSLVEGAWNVPLETLAGSEERVARLLPATEDWGGRMPAPEGCVAPTPQNRLGWQSPLDRAVRMEPGNPEFYHSKLGAIVRRTTSPDPMMDSRQASSADYSAATLALFDANGRRREFEGGTIESEFVCYAKGGYPFYFIEVTQPCHFHCLPDQFLLKLGPNGWTKIALPTIVYQRVNDFDNDGNIDFEGELVHVQYRQCTYLACGSSLERAVSVKAPYTWNGSRFIPNRPSFRSLYQERYADALKLVQSKAEAQQSECDDEILQAIGQVIVLGRVLHRPRPEWLTPVDKAMKEATSEECKPGKDEEHDQILGYTPWRSVRAQLLSASVPPL